MRKIFFLLTALPLLSTAQNKEEPKVSSGKNVVKINLSSVVLKNISLQYERAAGKKTSVALGIRFMPKGTVPFKSTFEDQIDNNNVNVNDFKIGNFALTPEFRFYLGKKENMRGFYIAPYLRYANFDLEAPVDYNDGLVTKTGLFTGKINSFSGGIMFGSQFKFGKNWVLDWWIIGAHIGSGNGNLVYKAATPLTPAEQADLQSSLDELDVPFVKFESSVNASGATVKAKGSWGGVRGLGINIGYRF